MFLKIPSQVPICGVSYSNIIQKKKIQINRRKLFLNHHLMKLKMTKKADLKKKPLSPPGLILALDQNRASKFGIVQVRVECFSEGSPAFPRPFILTVRGFPDHRLNSSLKFF